VSREFKDRTGATHASRSTDGDEQLDVAHYVSASGALAPVQMLMASGGNQAVVQLEEGFAELHCAPGPYIPTADATARCQAIEDVAAATPVVEQQIRNLQNIVDASFVVLAAVRRGESLTKESQEAYDRAKTLAEPTSFARLVSFLGGTLTLAGGIVSAVKAIKSLSSALSGVADGAAGLTGGPTQSNTSPSAGEATLEAATSSQDVVDGGKTAVSAVRAGGGSGDPQRDWMAQNSAALVSIGEAQSWLNAQVLVGMELILHAEVARAGRAVTHTYELLAVERACGRKMQSDLLDRLLGAADRVANALTALEPKVRYVESLTRALAAAVSATGEVDFAPDRRPDGGKSASKPTARTLFDLLYENEVVGSVPARDAVKLIEVERGKVIELDPTFEYERAIHDFVAGPVDQGNTAPRHQAYIFARPTAHATQPATYHLRIVVPEARVHLLPLLDGIRSDRPERSDEIELTPATAAALKALEGKLDTEVRPPMLQPYVGGFHDSEFAFGLYSSPDFTKAPELLGFVRAYPELFMTERGEPLEPSATIHFVPGRRG